MSDLNPSLNTPSAAADQRDEDINSEASYLAPKKGRSDGDVKQCEFSLYNVHLNCYIFI